MTAVYSSTWFGKKRGHNRGAGLRLYYGGTDNQVQEIAFAFGEASWSSQSTLKGTNGNAGISASLINEVTGLADLYVLDMTNQFRAWNLNSSVKVNNTTGTYGNWTEGMCHPTISKMTQSLCYHLSLRTN